jgi:CO/xanthine dehydrogenase FAD-binding subunit
LIKPFRYFKPRSLQEALAVLEEDGARALAGGSDLLVEMRDGKSSPHIVVDLKALPGLDRFQVSKVDGIVIGARVTLTELVESDALQSACPLLRDACQAVGTLQVRNRATLVGNLCTASPAADTAPALLVTEARIVIASRSGERVLPLQEFILGPKRNALKRGEVVIQVEIPHMSPDRAVFLKKTRVQGHDLATVNMAGRVDMESGVLQVAIGACSPVPVRLERTGALLMDANQREAFLSGFSDIAQASIQPITDLRGSAEYRRAIVAVFLKRMMDTLFPEDREIRHAS